MKNTIVSKIKTFNIWAKVFFCLSFVGRYLPTSIHHKLRRFFWHSFWIREELEEERELGVKSRSPIGGSERAVFTECIGEAHPFSSLLEVGCGFGQGFFTFADVFSGVKNSVKFVGIDSNERRISEGKTLLVKRGLEFVDLQVADGAALPFAEGSFDIVVSAGFMLFVPPEKIGQVLSEMLRVCGRRIFLLEQHHDANFSINNQISTYIARKNSSDGYWLHDFNLLFAKQPDVRKVIIHTVPHPRWDLEHWMTNGAVVEVRKVL